VRYRRRKDKNNFISNLAKNLFIYLFMVYLTKVSAAQAFRHRMSGRVVNWKGYGRGIIYGTVPGTKLCASPTLLA
jgi:hypothetical protein